MGDMGYRFVAGRSFVFGFIAWSLYLHNHGQPYPSPSRRRYSFPCSACAISLYQDPLYLPLAMLSREVRINPLSYLVKITR